MTGLHELTIHTNAYGILAVKESDHLHDRG